MKTLRTRVYLRNFRRNLLTILKDLGTCKGDFSKSIRKLKVSIEKGFGQVRAELQATRCDLATGTEKTRGQFKAQIKPVMWVVHVLLGGGSIVSTIFTHSYLSNTNIHQCVYFLVETHLKKPRLN